MGLIKKAADLGRDFCNGHAVAHYLYNGGVASNDFEHFGLFRLLRGLRLCRFLARERASEYFDGGFHQSGRR